MSTDYTLDIDAPPSIGWEPSAALPVIARHIRTRCGHIVAYHACSGRWLDKIRQEGLTPLTKQRLKDLALEFFTMFPSDVVIRTVEELDGYDLCIYTGTVGFFASARESMATTWLRHPCCVSLIARKLTADTTRTKALLDKIEDAARPTFVKCRLPLDWVCERAREKDDVPLLYAEALAMHRAGEHDETCSLLFEVRGSIPPQFVMDALDVELSPHPGNEEAQHRRAGYCRWRVKS